MESHDSSPDFMLDSLTVGTAILLKYQLFNDRTNDYKRMSLKEKEDWHPDFAEIVSEITKAAAAVATLDLKSDRIRNCRAKKLAFEGLKCKCELHVYTHDSLEPIKVTTHEFSIDAETKLQVTDEAKQYIFKDKRRQGDLFSLGEAIIENKPKEKEQQPQPEPEFAA